VVSPSSSDCQIIAAVHLQCAPPENHRRNPSRWGSLTLPRFDRWI
jgi:hypothetical protein